MEEKKFTLQLRFGRRELTALGALAVLALGTAPLSTETLTLSTYYPSPYGVYSQLRTTGNTFLAYTPGAGAVGVGTLNPSANIKMTVVGKAGIDSLYVNYNPYPGGAAVADIDIGGNNGTNLMWANQHAALVNDQGGSLELGGNNNKGNGGGTPYIDFHTQNATAVDYDYRLMPTWDGALGMRVMRLFGAGGSEDAGVIGLACRNVNYVYPDGGNPTSCPQGWSIYLRSDGGGNSGRFYYGNPPQSLAALMTTGGGNLVAYTINGNGSLGAPVAAGNQLDNAPATGTMFCCKFASQ